VDVAVVVVMLIVELRVTDVLVNVPETVSLDEVPLVGVVVLLAVSVSDVLDVALVEMLVVLVPVVVRTPMQMYR